MAVTQSSTEILAEADRIIHGERAQSYGSAEDSFTRIGQMWTAYLGVEVDAYDVAMLMTLMKVSRGKTDVKRDTAVDIAGYAALSERCAVAAGRMTSGELKADIDAIMLTSEEYQLAIELMTNGHGRFVGRFANPEKGAVAEIKPGVKLVFDGGLKWEVVRS